MIHELPKCDVQTFLDGIRVYEYCITHWRIAVYARPIGASLVSDSRSTISLVEFAFANSRVFTLVFPRDTEGFHG